jgi:hypothetical protein
MTNSPIEPPLDDPGAYGCNPPNMVEDDFHVPPDLVHYYRQFRPGYWGYVCPSCKCVLAPGWGANIPDQFRAHIRPHLEGKGCFLNPKKV